MSKDSKEHQFRVSGCKAKLTTWLSLLLLTAFWVAPLMPAYGQASTPIPQQQAEELLKNLTPEERVGQLFLITFPGAEVGTGTQINDLITNHHIGGVVLLAANDNFAYIDPANSESLRQTLTLNRQLQQAGWSASRQSQTNPVTGESFYPSFIPLFLGISQEGDNYPYDQILSGVTFLPNQMALGATWKPELAAEVGAIQGQELSTLGFNLLLGPSLDVLETPQIDTAYNLGTRAFGGDPFWVGEMGRAYVRGVHQGSAGKMAVVAKHFPGHGSSDRLPEDEVATVRKTFEQLISFDLAPFFVVTGNAASPEETVDGLLASHIRYQGLQGNIRATTRPVSFDPQAFTLLMSLTPLQSWQQNGGLMISDDLGSRAVRRFYELTSQTFEPRRVALNAFLAGNDLLYFADFSSVLEPDAYTATIRTLEFFAQKYREDTAFAQRVDTSVLRILTLKLRLYKDFNLGNVLSSTGDINDLGKSGQVTFNVAQQAATLLHPSQTELEDSIPDPPNQNDRIVFITDTRYGQQCSQCQPFSIIDVKALQEAVVRLYGPQAGGQVTLSYLSSYMLTDLQAMLDASQPDLPLESDLTRANWIVFAMLPAEPDIPSFQILSRFLSERPDLFQQKRLVVFAFSAPYYLDATNISKLDAYYGLYSKEPQFVDIAAYLLFRELRPTGASPVSVPGIRYDLNEALFPDPNRAIPLAIDLPPSAVEATPATLEPTPAPQYHIGDMIPLVAGSIQDHNGNPVPDGTPVTFVLTTGVEANSVRQVETTKSGVARTTLSVTSPGAVEIHAESETARSDSLHFDIPSPSGEVVTATPTELPTATITPSPVPPTPQPAETPAPAQPPDRPGLGDWLMAVMISIVIAWSSYRLAALIGQVRWGVRTGFLALIGGLAAYSYLALEMPGSRALLDSSVPRSIFLGTLAGAALGLLIALSWRAIVEIERRRN